MFVRLCICLLVLVFLLRLFVGLFAALQLAHASQSLCASMAYCTSTATYDWLQLRTTAYNCARVRTTAHDCVQLRRTACDCARLHATTHNCTTVYDHERLLMSCAAGICLFVCWPACGCFMCFEFRWGLYSMQVNVSVCACL